MLLYLDPRNLMLYLPKNPNEHRGDLSEFDHSTNYIIASCISGASRLPFHAYEGERNSYRHFPWENLWHCALFAAQDVELVGVTASGDNEKKKLAELLDSVQPDLREIFDSMLHILVLPDCDPPERLVKHHIFVFNIVCSCCAIGLSHGGYEAGGDAHTDEGASREGLVVPSMSPWAALILFVAKDGGKSLRMCVDFRDLNALTKKDRFPLPRLEILLHRARRANIFSKIDLGIRVPPN